MNVSATMTRAAVIRADAMLTPGGVVVEAELAWDDSGRITYAGPARSGSRVTHDFSGRALMPGLVNAHTHSAMTLMRGISDDDGFLPWLAAVQSCEQRLTHDDVAAGLDLAMLEMIETGTTAFADMYCWDAALIERVRSTGMRVFAGLAVTGPAHVPFPRVSPLNGAELLDAAEELAARYARDPQVRVGYAPHAPYSCPPEFLREVRDRAIRHDLPVHTHVAESVGEVEMIRERYGTTPVGLLEHLDLFAARVHAAHCVHLAAGDPELFAARGVSVSHNPVSNLKLECGVAPYGSLRDAGVRLALGTDSVASNNSLDLFEEVKLTALLHRGASGTAVSAREVLDLVTAGGAAAIGFPETGALAEGRLADVIAVDLGGTAAVPLEPERLMSFLGYSATGAAVRDVFIDGRHVYADGRHRTLDASRVRERAREARARLLT